MDPPAQLLTFAPPSETALLNFSRAHVSREMIHEIASNDYEKDILLHELGILQQLTPAPDLGLLSWHPREVLELERWNEPEEGDPDRPPTGTTGHLKRLFTCTILLRNVAFISNEEWDGDMEFFIAISAVTALQLVRSSIALGNQASRLACGFLLWLHGKQSDPLLRPFVSFGVLLLQIQEDPSGAGLLNTCEWAESEESSAREQLKKNDDIHSSRWLLGLNYQECDRARRPTWADTVERVIAARAGHVPPEVESALRRMYERLLG
jgi:hypothetical protein